MNRYQINSDLFEKYLFLRFFFMIGVVSKFDEKNVDYSSKQLIG